VTHDLPDAETLARGLTAVLAGPDVRDSVRIESRTVNPYTSSTASELITCDLRGVGRFELFCKYGAGAPEDNRGHRGGLAYEAFVHDRILGTSTKGPPSFYGAFPLSNTRLALVFDDLPGAVRVSKLPAIRGLCGAAAWIGHFHASHALDAKNEAPIPLLRYHLDYYLGWADRTRRFAALEGPEPRWLAGLCGSFARVARLLVEGSLTVIHGEYYPDNVLVRETVVHPVDWQTAAVAAGEIDLAALTERWPRAVAEQCERAYRSARWADETPASFPDTLLAARLYLHFRWLGDRPEWTRAERFRSHWVALRSIAAQLDALAPSAGGH
jgi:hypothetical protein